MGHIIYLLWNLYKPMKPVLTKYKGLVVHHSKTSKVMANICLTDCIIAITCLRLDRRSLKTKSVEQFGETWSCKLPTFPICLFCGAQYSWLTQALAPPSSEIKWKVSHFCITIFCYFVLLVWFIAENLFFSMNRMVLLKTLKFKLTL